MGKEVNDEKEFLENLDRLLAGEEIKADQVASDDCRSAIDFAKKIVECSIEPSPAFKKRLKGRLLQKLVEQEAEVHQKEKVNWFWEGLRKLFLRRPVWQYATAMVVALIMIVSAIVLSPDEGPIIVMPENLLGLEAVPQETVISLAEEVVEIELVFQNTSSESLIMALLPPSIEILRIDDGEVVRNLEAGDDRVEILPSESMTYILVWDLRDNSGEKVLPGWYSININDVILSKAGEPTEIHQRFGAVAQLFVE